MHPGLHAIQNPRKPAIIMGSGPTVTYGELEERSARLAHLLSSRGLRPGDNVAILAENHPRFFEVYWAAIRSGLYLTAINWHLTPEEAALQMELLGHDFFFFTNADTDRAAVMYRRDDGDLGLIDEAGLIPETYEDAVASSQPHAPDQPRGDVMLLACRVRRDDPRASSDNCRGCSSTIPRSRVCRWWSACSSVWTNPRPTCVQLRSTTPPGCSGRRVCTRWVRRSW